VGTKKVSWEKKGCLERVEVIEMKVRSSNDSSLECSRFEANGSIVKAMRERVRQRVRVTLDGEGLAFMKE
jgi:hypothetical protein